MPSTELVGNALFSSVNEEARLVRPAREAEHGEREEEERHEREEREVRDHGRKVRAAVGEELREDLSHRAGG